LVAFSYALGSPTEAIGRLIAGVYRGKPVEEVSYEIVKERMMRETPEEAAIRAGVGVAELPSYFLVPYGVTKGLTRLAVSYPKVAKLTEFGLRAAGAGVIGWEIGKVVKEPTPERIAITGVRFGTAFGLGYWGYTTAKKEIIMETLKKTIIKAGLPEREAELVGKRLIAAERAGIQPKPRSLRSVLQKMPRTKGKTGRIILDWLKTKDAIVYGSAAYKTQIPEMRTPHDVDVAVSNPRASARELFNALRNAGIKGLKLVGTKIYGKTGKIIEFHSFERYASHPYYTGETVISPEGIRLQTFKEQIMRKAFESWRPERAKDLADFLSGIRGTRQIMRAEAEEAIAPVKWYKKLKLFRLL